MIESMQEPAGPQPLGGESRVGGRIGIAAQHLPALGIRHPAALGGYRPDLETRRLRLELRRAFQQTGQGSGPRYL
ncbi:MAG TPA: hypothetical protein VFZ13_08250 [Gemmatimonadales bacterium]